LTDLLRPPPPLCCRGIAPALRSAATNQKLVQIQNALVLNIEEIDSIRITRPPRWLIPIDALRLEQ
jgi:hypothetical protein